MTYLRTAAQRRWATAIGDFGFHHFVRLAYAKRPPFQRAYPFLAKLEEAGVIAQWTIEIDGEPYDMRDPHCPPQSLSDFTAAPLFIAGPNWDAFAAEMEVLVARP